MDPFKEDTPTVVLVRQPEEEPEMKILFNANPDQPDRDDRTFAATGGCELDRFTAMVECIKGTGLFTRVTQGGIIVRFVLLPGKTWESPLNFSGEGIKRPRRLADVRKQLQEDIPVNEGDTTKKEDIASVLAYVLALLWDGAGWDEVDDVIVEEAVIA